MKRAALVFVFLAGCKVGADKYCEQAKADRLFDPSRPGLCEEYLRQQSVFHRDCLIECAEKKHSTLTCNDDCGLHDVVRNAAPPASK